jgi:hypothetical protein
MIDGRKQNDVLGEVEAVSCHGINSNSTEMFKHVKVSLKG